jgi:methyl-accepting chemotaxis protein/methyl-accepting chemotaxis protein-1 (serine sensor receptor)
MSRHTEHNSPLESKLRFRLISKVTLTYVAMAIVAGVSGYIGVSNMRSADQEMGASLKNHLTPLRDLKTISDLYAVNVVDTVHKTRAGTVSFDEAIKRISDARSQSAPLWQSYKELRAEGEEADIVRKAEDERVLIEGALEKLDGEVLRKKDKAALVRFAERDMYPLVDPFTDHVGKLIEIQIADSRGAVEHVGALSKTSATLLLGLAGGSVALAVLFSVLVGWRLRKLSTVATSLRDMTAALQHASSEISSGTSDLSSRTEQQAASLEETASSMEEMAATVKQNADNSQQANRLAVNSRQTAERGGAVVRSAVNAMEQINTASTKISEIIDVIDEIAFQTNLLALNAAVEAARAGEQGRGFAVVASEVRSLAQRSATAAQEIKALIKDSVVRVAEGSKLVQESGKTLEEIIAAAKKVAEIIAEMSASSQEQTSGIDQVNAAVNQMDKFTQQNAAMAEQVASSSAAMAQQTSEMETMVAFVSVGGEGGRAKPEAHAAAAPRAKAATPSHRESAPSKAKKPVASAARKPDQQPTSAPADDFPEMPAELTLARQGSGKVDAAGFEEF